MINRLIEPTDGTITINGADVRDQSVTELRRGIGYVIQQVGLFPHKTIAQNIGAVPKLLGWDKAATKDRVHELAAGVVFGGSAQCIEREDCLLGYEGETYGLTFEDVKTLEYGPPLAAGLESGDIDAAQYQTTAPEIDSGKFVVLEDDKGLFSADNIVPIVRAEVADEELLTLLDELSAQLTTEDLIGWNVKTDIEKEEPVDVAEDWLKEEGLI